MNPEQLFTLDSLPAEAYLTALSCLPELGPARMRVLLTDRTPAEAWAAVNERPTAELRASLGRAGDRLLRGWRSAGLDLEPRILWAAHRAAGVGVLSASSPAYPAPLVGDPDRPEILFCDGDPAAILGPRVAIVGTRRCTRYGFDVARDLGRELAAEGVVVISGLALGIDGAAHRGALDAGGVPPVAFVANGLDRPYPRANAALWHEVAAAGAVLSEWPLGIAPSRWRFPARNRLIAACADVVVVVESAVAGGSLHTVREAAERGVGVMAVPGPIRSGASAGTNRLLAEGCAPVCDVDDIFCALSLTEGQRRSASERTIGTGHDIGCGPDQAKASSEVGPGAAVLDAIGWQAASLDDIVAASGLDAGTVAAAVGVLEAEGHLVRRGGWFERCAPAPRPRIAGE